MIRKNTFTILHLSDLHIKPHGKDKNFSIVLKRMIDHILTVTNENDQIVIVFTGDLVEQAKFDAAEKTVIDFFSTLKEKLGDQVIDIVFTPGNHDKNRGALVLNSSFKDEDEEKWEKFKRNEWQYFENQFDDYKKLVKKVQKDIFNVTPQENRTYGIRTVKIDSVNICFLCINSAWACIDNKDEGNLRIGRFQLDDIMDEYQKIKKDVDLVIAIMHHPTDWLTKAEQKYLNQYMTDEYRLNTNIILQGHIHEKEMYNWYNQYHSITTLVTGMGWDQQKEIKDNGHRYSLYRVNMESAIIEVSTYVTDKSGNFCEDSAIYNGNNIVFPLYIHKFLELNNLTFKNSEIPFFYPNYNPAESLEKIFNRVNDVIMGMMRFLKETQIEVTSLKLISKNIADEIFYNMDDKRKASEQLEKEKLKAVYMQSVRMSTIEEIRKKLLKGPVTSIGENIVDRFFESIYEKLDNMDTVENLKKSWNDFLERYIKIYVKNKFYAFIGFFCIIMGDKFFPQQEYEEGDAIRIHFRKVNVDPNGKVMYNKLFVHYVTKKEDELNVERGEDAELSDILYKESMIEKSYTEGGRTLLFSLNPSSNKHKSKSDWIDFITIAPKIECNKYIHKKEYYEEEVLPYLSFGISVNCIHFQRVLRDLAYFNFENVICKILEEFYKILSLDFEELLEQGEQDNEAVLY